MIPRAAAVALSIALLTPACLAADNETLQKIMEEDQADRRGTVGDARTDRRDSPLDAELIAVSRGAGE